MLYMAGFCCPFLFADSWSGNQWFSGNQESNQEVVSELVVGAPCPKHQDEKMCVASFQKK